MAVHVPSDPITDRIPVQRIAGPGDVGMPLTPMPPTPLPTPPPRRGRASIAIAVAFGLLAGVAGTVAAFVIRDSGGADRAAIPSAATSAAPATRTSPAPLTIRASLALSATSKYGTGISASGGTCKGVGGYADIQTGAGVTVTYASGAVVATGWLGTGSGSGSTCTFPLSITPVSGESPFYSIEVSHRGKVTFPQSQLRTGAAMLSLGND